MAINAERFSAARRASGMTIEQITKAAGLKSASTFMTHEDAPLQFRLSEINGMYQCMNDDARRILREAVGDIFLP